MEIESLRLDFQPYKYQRKTQNISEKTQRRRKKKEKKKQNKERRTQIREKRENLEKAHNSPHQRGLGQRGLGLVWPGLAHRNRSPDPGRTRPGSRTWARAAWVVGEPRLRDPSHR